MSEWKKLVREGADAGTTDTDSIRFLLTDGYMGIRGTPDEYSAAERAAVNLGGLYDGVPGKWRESVNAPYPLHMHVEKGEEEISLRTAAPEENRFELDFHDSVLVRESVFGAGGAKLKVASERFLPDSVRQAVLSRTVLSADGALDAVAVFRLEGDVWDINGPHLEGISHSVRDGVLLCSARTQEAGVPVCTALCVLSGGKPLAFSGDTARAEVSLGAGREAVFERYAAVFWGEGCEDRAEACVKALAAQGYESVLAGHRKAWAAFWDVNDVEIEGDERAQFGLRYSAYRLFTLAPYGKGSIPARGLSAQVYKGAVFWDTEIFMLPCFLLNDRKTSETLVRYRIGTLPAAKEKALYYDCRGAFYAWESQDTGADSCSDFNVTDIFTNRPVRTHFRDGQIHISAAVSRAIWQYVQRYGDTDILWDGGLETLLECGLFYVSRSYYNHNRKRYELLDVVGPDEYHEGVNNNAYTNYMAADAAEIAIKAYETMAGLDAGRAQAIADGVEPGVIATLREWAENLYLPQPDSDGVIEQYDHYMRQEDITAKEVAKRLVHPKEYWGTANGIAAGTRVLKQADTVALCVVSDRFSDAVTEANYDFYLKYTEHGSSLSACMYALAACRIGRPDDAMPLFYKTAEADLREGTKQWLGSLYIGGQHPAACGGAWMCAIEGFCGLRYEGDRLTLRPMLPSNFVSMRFRGMDGGKLAEFTVTHDGYTRRELE